MIYQPMQCDKTPWVVWSELGDVKFIKAPTDEELIQAYYSSQAIEISGVTKVELGVITCTACYTCPTSYNFTLKTNADNVDRLKETGWKLNS